MTSPRDSYTIDNVGHPGEPDFWKPKTKTEREMLESMEEEMRTTRNEVELVRDRLQEYYNLRRRGYTFDSNIDLEMVLKKVRMRIMIFESQAEKLGENQLFYEGMMHAYSEILGYITCLYEAKEKLKRELEEGT